MRPIHLFDLASQHNHWLSTRQTLMAGNIANVNTPGYRALDLQPFEAVLQATRLELAVTETGHMKPGRAEGSSSSEVEGEDSWEVYHSGASVSVEQELLKAGEISRSYTLNTNMLKAFHRILLSSTRAGA